MAKSARPFTLVGSAVEGVGDVAAYVVTAPTRIPIFRELLKEGIKLGFRASHLIRSLAADQGRQWQEVVREAQEESAGAAARPAERSRRSASAAADEKAEEQVANPVEALDGVGPDTARLFRGAGVRTTRDLAKQDAEALRKKLKEINDRKSIVSNVPSVTRIRQWIKDSQ